MNVRRVVYTPRAERDLAILPPDDRAAVMDAVGAWARHEPHVDIEKLTDVRRWRIRVGRWRAPLDRKDVYRR